MLALVGGSLAGWVAARVARYDGTRNGLLAGIALVLLAAGTVAAGLAARDTGAVLPGHLTAPRATAASLAAGAIAVVAAALAGAAGGRWHRQVDDVLLRTRAGGVSPYPEEAR